MSDKLKQLRDEAAANGLINEVIYRLHSSPEYIEEWTLKAGRYLITNRISSSQRYATKTQRV
jgi:hypothetical protein